ncbi:ATPase AAA-type core domain-containing protein [Candidatus Electrothrix laxa]
MSVKETKQNQERRSTLSLRNLFLDPNNYRFIGSEVYVKVDESDVLMGDVQRRTTSLILGKNAEYVRDLVDSFKKNGFLPVDQIQVRRVEDTGKFIVVEGNRRVACLKYLQSRFEAEGFHLGKLDPEVFSKVPVVYYNDADDAHHLILMGLKHISGNKKWPAINQAKLIRTLNEEKQMSPEEIHQSLGVSKQETNATLKTLALIDTYIKSDYGDQFESDKYSIFREIIRNRKIRSWLLWDDSHKKVDNVENLERLFSWISEEEELGDDETTDDLMANGQKLEAVIETSKQIRELAKIIDDDKALDNLDTTRNLTEATLASEVLGKNQVKNALSIIGQEINTVFNMSKLISDSDRTDIHEYSDKLKSLLEIGVKQSISASMRTSFLDSENDNKISSIHISQFRRFKETSLDNLSRVNLFAGINNAGKTTLLECIKLLCDLNNPKSFIELIRRRAKIPSEEVNMEWFVEQIPDVAITAQFDQKPVVLKLTRESSSVDDMTYYLQSACFDIQYGERAFSSETHFFEKYPQRTEGEIASLCPSVFASPFSGLDPGLLKECHSKSLKEGSKGVIVEFLRAYVDAGIRNIEQDDFGRFTVIHENINPNPDLTIFGEGLQRIFKIGLLFAGAKNGVVIIDELENAIHASLLPKLVKLINELSLKFNIQVFISSHSKECIDAFAKSENIPEKDLSAYSLVESEGEIECFYFSGERMHKLVDSISFDLRGEVSG